MDLQTDIDAFFSELKVKHGLADEDATPAEEAAAAVSERQAPAAPAIPEPAEAVETYPGSKRPLRTVEPSEPDEDPVWDDRPRTYTVGGKDMEFFSISALATALRRQAVTMRKWEDKGHIPPARWRSPGEGKKQDRLYTRPQIEGLVAIAKEEGLMDPKKKLRIDQTRFPERAHRLFAALENRSRQ